MKRSDRPCPQCGGPVMKARLRPERVEYCSPHCQHLALSVPHEPLAERFWRQVDTTGACWIWMGSRDPNNYGKVTTGSMADGSRRPRLAHRIAWELEHGPIPDGLFVCHGCDNPPCVRPSHMFLGTQADNLADMRAKGRYVNGMKLRHGHG